MNTITEVIDSRIEEEIVSLTEYLVSGKAPHYDDYRYVCGRIRGLRDTQRMTNDLLRQQMDDDDD
jgi:hypothetical protein